jgi:hypothetical protein
VFVAVAIQVVVPTFGQPFKKNIPVNDALRLLNAILTVPVAVGVYLYTK